MFWLANHPLFSWQVTPPPLQWLLVFILLLDWAAQFERSVFKSRVFNLKWYFKSKTVQKLPTEPQNQELSACHLDCSASGEGRGLKGLHHVWRMWGLTPGNSDNPRDKSRWYVHHYSSCTKIPSWRPQLILLTVRIYLILEQEVCTKNTLSLHRKPFKKRQFVMSQMRKLLPGYHHGELVGAWRVSPTAAHRTQRAFAGVAAR